MVNSYFEHPIVKTFCRWAMVPVIVLSWAIMNPKSIWEQARRSWYDEA